MIQERGWAKRIESGELRKKGSSRGVLSHPCEKTSQDGAPNPDPDSLPLIIDFYLLKFSVD
jgi:hypothetical protein